MTLILFAIVELLLLWCAGVIYIKHKNIDDKIILNLEKLDLYLLRNPNKKEEFFNILSPFTALLQGNLMYGTKFNIGSRKVERTEEEVEKLSEEILKLENEENKELRKLIFDTFDSIEFKMGIRKYYERKAKIIVLKVIISILLFIGNKKKVNEIKHDEEEMIVPNTKYC